MSDTTYQTFQHYGTAAERAAFTPNPAAGIKPIYIWYETDTTKTFLYHTAWVELSNFDQADADLLYAALIHAPTHSSGGTDPIDVTDLDGFPGGTTNFLREDGTFAAPSAGVVRKQITLIIDGGSTVITTGFKTSVSLPVAGTLKKWRILADVSGSIVIDVWKDVYASYPPTVADTITAAAKPTLSGALSAESSTLTGWTTAFSAGDVFGFNVDSVTTVTKISLFLEYE